MAKKPIKIDYSPSDFLGGTILLSPWEELAYRRICDLIYVMDGELPDDKALADLTKTKSRWPAVRKRLLFLEKIQVKNGRIFNERCTAELIKKRAMIEKAQRGAEMTNTQKKKKTRDAVATAQRSAGRDAGRSPEGSPGGSQPLTLPINRESIANTESSSPAREPTVAMTVADECFKLTGIDPEGLRDFGSSDRQTVASWLNAGADPERHIYPTIERIMENRPEPPNTLRYFGKAVHEAIENVPVQPNGADAKPNPWAYPKKLESEYRATDRQWWDRLKNYHLHDFWHDQWGDNPDQPGCQCDTEVMALWRERVAENEATEALDAD